MNPKPWETVVRIKVFGRGTIGFGSGTIIASTPEESIILTCAHIFKNDRGPQVPASQFRRKLTVDLFDGVRSGPKRNQVHYSNETFDGEAIDYDFGRDVGLIRIHPGRRLPYAKVVPPHWTPKARFGMITVGCSHGQDATAWNAVITNPLFRGLNGQPSYEAVECSTAPSEGRSGGGLFTTDGYVAGVCDFAEPNGDRGLYATPRSIYHILDRNNLMALYTPTRDDANATLVASRGNSRKADGVRLQSPGRDDPGAPGVMLPPPGMLGIKPPVLASNDSRRVPARRGAWQATPAPNERRVEADLQMDAATDPDRFNTDEPTGDPEDAIATDEAAPREPAPAPARAVPRRGVAGKWRPSHEPVPELAGFTR